MHRVVITGVGAVTPIGNDAETFWTSVKENKKGIGPITHIDSSGTGISVAGEVKNFDPSNVLSRKDIRRQDKFSQFAVVAADEALKDSEYEITDENATRVGSFIGTGIGGFQTIEDGVRKLVEKGPRRISPLFVPMAISNMAASNIGIHTGARGTSMAIVTACASGTDAIGEAYIRIKAGMLDASFAGGTEAAIIEVALGSFANLRALSTNSDPETASRPFDKDRDGFVAGEGSGVVFMESLESAQARGADILAEVVGYGSNADAYHMTAPRPDGSGAGETMIAAMKEANITPDQIDYINAHGTSTPTNDSAETKSIKYALGDAAYDVPVSSIKGHIGHLLGAAGGIETVLLAKSLRDQYIPATLGLENPDEECDLDYVPHNGREAELEYVMSNSLGFGGHNATIILKRWDGE